MSMVEKFKENKKIMDIKMEQVHKLADEASNEFIESIKSLVKDASVEDVQTFLNSEDDDIDEMDKLAVIAAWAEENENVGGIAIVGIKR